MTGKRRETRRSATPLNLRAHGTFERVGSNHFAGTATVPDLAGQTYVLEVLADGLPIRALLTAKPAIEHGAAGAHTFQFELDDDVLGRSTSIEVRLANVGVSIGSAIRVGAEPEPFKISAGSGRLTWLGGLHFEGYLPKDADCTACNVWVDGAIVMQAIPLGWSDTGSGDMAGEARRAVNFHLPGAFADGRMRRTTLRLDTGAPVGSPVSFVAYPDGLAHFLGTQADLQSERPRAEMFDRMLPSSLPFADYERWHNLVDTPPAQSELPVLVVIVGEDGAALTAESLDLQNHADWSAIVVSNIAGPLTFSAVDVSQGLRELGSEPAVVVTCVAGTIFKAGALERVSSVFEKQTDTTILYGDSEWITTDGRRWPIAFPAFDYERALEQGYLAACFATDGARFLSAISSGVENLFELVFELIASPPHTTIRHLPVALTQTASWDCATAAPLLASACVKHLSAIGVHATATPMPSALFPSVWVRYVDRLPPVTIIIPTRNRADLLRTCLGSIERSVRRANASVLIADNDSTDDGTLSFLKELSGPGISVQRVSGHFNFSRINNIAVDLVNTPAICLMNNDVVALDDDWLDEMRSRLIAPKVGAVGVMLIRDNGLVQHGGIVLGPHFDADHAFTNRLYGDPGYLELLHCAHECSAVTAACLLTWTDLYKDTGGLDETLFPIAYNDVDYSLRLRALGYRIVFTPRVKLVHNESQSRGRDIEAHKAQRFERERDYFRARWEQSLLSDPYYSPNLNLSGTPYSSLAWPPRDRNARINLSPEPRPRSPAI